MTLTHESKYRSDQPLHGLLLVSRCDLQSLLMILLIAPFLTALGCESPPPTYLNSEEMRTRDAKVMINPPIALDRSAQMDLSSTDMSTINDQELTDLSTPSQPCISACDCSDGLDCLQGGCQRGSTPVYCCTHGECPEQSQCVTPAGERRQCNQCTNACDCPYGESCDQGQCVMAISTVFCCDRSPCPVGERCEGSGGPTCPSGCQTACDCWGGEACVEGICVREAEASYCCERSLCPQGSGCEYDDGSQGLCPVYTCLSACDCPSGQACVDGGCELSESLGLTYCCEDAGCPVGRACELPNGNSSTCVGEPECAVTCDCSDLAGSICQAGRCTFPANNEPLVVCCETDCISGLACERLNGERQVCP